ncbi:MAG: sulfotransferase family protein [Pseudomonadota bacterium]
MQFLGVGLSKTGTSSLHRAMRILGFKSLHYDAVRLKNVILGIDNSPDFKIYDDLDVVSDLPSAFFYKEFARAYPNLKFILTVRDEDEWWVSIRNHYRRHPVRSERDNPFRWHLRHYVYGSAIPNEFLFKKRFRDHNQAVMATIQADRLLVMNITAGDGWAALCDFVERPQPRGVPFPVANRAQEAATTTVPAGSARAGMNEAPSKNR